MSQQNNGDDTAYDPELMDRVKLNNGPNDSSDIHNNNDEDYNNSYNNSRGSLDSGVSDLDDGDEDHHHHHHHHHNHHDVEQNMALMDVRNRLRQGRRKGIQRFTVAFIVFVLLFLIGMGLTGRKGKENAEEQQQQDALDKNNSIAIYDENGNVMLIDEDLNYETPTTTLPPPPSDLESKCSINAVSTPAGIQGCESVCEESECCDVPAGFALSCQTGNERVCPQYQKYCNILHNINSAAASAYIPEDFTTTSLSAADAVLQSQIDTACNAQEGGGEVDPTCTSLCQEGICCFDANSSTSAQISCNNNVNCDVYTSCAATIHGSSAGGGGSSGTIKEQITAACAGLDNAATSEAEGVIPPDDPATSACEQVCQVSFCCFNHYCVPPATLECLDYTGCYVVYNDEEDDDAVAAEYINNNEEFDALGDDIHTACFGASILDVGDDCATLCEPGRCCFQPSLGTNQECSAVDCELYAECNILYPGILATTRKEVEDACQDHNSAVGDGQTICEQVCSGGACCFRPPGTSNGVIDGCAEALDVDIYCRTYESCSVIFGESARLPATTPISELEQACTNAATRAHCVGLCADATCCYASNLDETCFHVNPEMICSNFKPCDILYATEGADGTR